MIRPLTRFDLPAAGDLLAAAFRDDPAWLHIAPGEKAMRGLLELGLRIDLASRALCDALEEDGRLLGLTVVYEEGVPKPGAGAFLLRLPSALPLLAKPAAAFRAIELLTAIDRVRPAKASYLKLLAVAPEAQGKGAGSELLARALGRTPPGTQLYLETFKAGNVAYYQKRGFRLRTEVRSAARPTFWTMSATSRR